MKLRTAQNHMAAAREIMAEAVGRFEHGQKRGWMQGLTGDQVQLCKDVETDLDKHMGELAFCREV
jgi:hypothetical protein